MKKDLLKIIAVVLALFPVSAYAYVDPGSGGAIITAILGFFGAVGYMARGFFYKIKRKLFGTKEESEEKNDN